MPSTIQWQRIFDAGKYLFKASGFSVKFDGFTTLYEEGQGRCRGDAEGKLPPIETGDALKVEIPGAATSISPSRRPGTPKLPLSRHWRKTASDAPAPMPPPSPPFWPGAISSGNSKALKPTILGEVTTKLMEEQFPNIVNVKFTANMEKSLDEVEEGKEDWVSTLSEFYDEFSATLETGGKEYGRHPGEDPRRGDRHHLREVRTPHGDHVWAGTASSWPAPVSPSAPTPRRLVEDTGGICPKCGGRIVVKKSKSGRSFYGCENYPTCDFMTWDKPIEEKCPRCGSTLFKKTGRFAKIHCLKEGCGYEKGVSKE